MTNLNDKLRAALKSAFLANGSRGPKYDAALLAEAINEIIATPAPQAAPSEDRQGPQIAEMARQYGWKPEGDEGAFEFVTRIAYEIGWDDARGNKPRDGKRAALAAPLTQAADQSTAGAEVVTAGWQLVPTTPQQGMINAFIAEYDRRGGRETGCYHAFLKAAPAAPLAQQSEPVAIVRKKFSNLPLGTCFRYIGGSEKWVVLERHGCGLVAGYQPHDGWVAGQSICSFADTEQECRETEVEVVLSAPLPAQQASESAAPWEFIADVSEQKPEKPDYWSSCGQCDNNIERARDLIDERAAMGDARKGGGNA